MSKALIIVVGILAAVAVISGFLLFSTMIEDMESENKPEGYYGYTIEFDDSFVDTYGHTITAAEGKQWAFVDVTIVNMSIEDGITNNILWYELRVAGIQHKSSFISFSHPSSPPNVTIMEGYYASTFIIYEIPAGIDTSSALLVYVGYDGLVLDNSKF